MLCQVSNLSYCLHLIRESQVDSLNCCRNSPPFRIPVDAIKKFLTRSPGKLQNEMQISEPGVLLTPSRINSKIGGVIRGGGNVSIDRQTVSTEVMTRSAAPPGRGHLSVSVSFFLSYHPLSLKPPVAPFEQSAFILSRLAERGHHGGRRWEEGGGGRSNIDPLPPERDSSLAHAPPLK